jgi:hypothetical protein
MERLSQPAGILLLKENNMSNSQNTNRVISRIGARELTPEELSNVSGAEGTIFLTYDPCTGEGDQRVD